MYKILLPLIFLITLIIPTNSEAYNDSVDWWSYSGVSAKSTGSIYERNHVVKQARQNLADMILGIHLTADETITNKMLGTVYNLGKVEETIEENGQVTITVSLPLYGQSNSLASRVFKVAKQFDFPATDGLKTQPTAGNYTSLIIDCTSWESENDTMLNPVMIQNIEAKNGVTIYDNTLLSREDVIAKGMVQYVANVDTAKKLKLAGNNPLIVKIAGLQNQNTNPVLFTSDAINVAKENESSHFLDKCAVIIVTKRVNIKSLYRRGGNAWGVRDSDIYS